MISTYFLKACLIFAFARNESRKLSTISKNQWFLGSPLPLMEWYQLNHWCQWFFNGFSDSQPSVTMVFDGCQPLVQRCDGNDTSFRSNHTTPYCGYQKWFHHLPPPLLLVQLQELYLHSCFIPRGALCQSNKGCGVQNDKEDDDNDKGSKSFNISGVFSS